MLQRALAYTYLPRVVTLCATAVALPIVTSGLGATQYGTAAAVTALAALVQIVSDAGISAAVSRSLAEMLARDGGASIKHELRAWTLIQIAVALISFVLMVAAAQLASGALVPGASTEMVILAAAALTVNTLSGYVRAVLRTVFAFGRLSIMDVSDSLARSSAWIMVGLYFRSAEALLLGELLAALVGLTVGTVQWRIVTARFANAAPAASAVGTRRLRTLGREILKQGGVFLLVRLATAGLTQFPILIASRLGQLETAAVLAVLFRWLDLVNGPVVVIGQIVGVKSVAAARDAESDERVQRLWSSCARICAVWMAIVAAFFLFSELIARYTLPTTPEAVGAFALFALFLLFHALSAIYGVPIDYLGGAKQRLQLMIPMLIFQSAALWIAGSRFGVIGVVAVIVACYALLVLAYMRLAHRILSATGPLRVPLDAFVVAALCLLWAALGALLAQYIDGLHLGVVSGAIAAVIIVGAANVPAIRAAYSPKALLNLD